MKSRNNTSLQNCQLRMHPIPRNNKNRNNSKNKLRKKTKINLKRPLLKILLRNCYKTITSI